MNEFNYGDKVKDKVTGYKGIITGKGDFFGKRPTLYLVESVDNTGRPCEWWVDNARLEVMTNE